VRSSPTADRQVRTTFLRNLRTVLVTTFCSLNTFSIHFPGPASFFKNGSRVTAMGPALARQYSFHCRYCCSRTFHGPLPLWSHCSYPPVYAPRSGGYTRRKGTKLCQCHVGCLCGSQRDRLLTCRYHRGQSQDPTGTVLKWAGCIIRGHSHAGIWSIDSCLDCSTSAARDQLCIRLDSRACNGP
jgi:hypothetical protein